jgi:hypothetical protein
MIEIEISTKYIHEFAYSANVILNTILGVPYKIVNCKGNKDIRIKSNSSFIIIPGDFWELENYLKKQIIPDHIIFSRNRFCFEKDIPVIFGNDIFREDTNSFYCGIDLFASSFFMLTRWEEYVTDLKDTHDRFPGNASLAYKFNFLQRPVVNEYAELLWSLLLHMGYKGQRKEREFRILPTHDIDQFRYWDIKKKKGLLKNLVSDLLIRKRPRLFYSRLKSFIGSVMRHSDPADTFDYLMDNADRIGSKACFYFIAGGVTAYDQNYLLNSVHVKRQIENIIKRGHRIGIHPSYSTYNDYNMLTGELSVLGKLSGTKIHEVRNHYLRFGIPITWEIMDKASLKIDSTMYYSDLPGFRCGICNEFPVYDIIQRKQLELIERPLLVMDTSYKEKVRSQCYSEITMLKETVKKYHGDFVFVWHNSKIETPEWKSYKKIFEDAFYGE